MESLSTVSNSALIRKYKIARISLIALSVSGILNSFLIPISDYGFTTVFSPMWSALIAREGYNALKAGKGIGGAAVFIIIAFALAFTYLPFVFLTKRKERAMAVSLYIFIADTAVFAFYTFKIAGIYSDTIFEIAARIFSVIILSRGHRAGKELIKRTGTLNPKSTIAMSSLASDEYTAAENTRVIRVKRIDVASSEDTAIKIYVDGKPSVNLKSEKTANIRADSNLHSVYAVTPDGYSSEKATVPTGNRSAALVCKVSVTGSYIGITLNEE